MTTETIGVKRTLRQIKEALAKQKGRHTITKRDPTTGFEEKMVHFGTVDNVPAGWKISD
jgi:hypothetical protein